MIENALFEEEQQQKEKARKIYEQVCSDIAPDYLKGLIMFINFEKRQNNIEKVKELYFKAFSHHLTSAGPHSSNLEVLSYITLQYARYLSFKCAEHTRAIDLMNIVLAKINYANKNLLLSFVNLVRHMEGSVGDVF